MNQYDNYGNIKGTLLDEIEKGDIVIYIDTKISGKSKQRIKLMGVWDGEKVQFDDKEKTLVRSKHWLRKFKH